MKIYKTIFIVLMIIAGLVFINSAIFSVFPTRCAGIALILAMLLSIVYYSVSYIYGALDNSLKFIYVVITPEDIFYFLDKKKADAVMNALLDNVYSDSNDVTMEVVWVDDSIPTAVFVDFTKTNRENAEITQDNDPEDYAEINRDYDY